MTTEEFKEIMCSRCIHYGDDCKDCIITETREKENETPTTRTWCEKYKKWSDFINQSFKNLDWRDGRDGEGKENRYRNNL